MATKLVWHVYQLLDISMFTLAFNDGDDQQIFPFGSFITCHIGFNYAYRAGEGDDDFPILISLHYIILFLQALVCF